MIYYALKSALLLTLLYGGFSALLSRETFHRFNRVMLLGIVVLSLVLPAVHITISSPEPIVLEQYWVESPMIDEQILAADESVTDAEATSDLLQVADNSHKEKDFWETVGILHDLDFELYPDQHCIKSQEIMREKGIDERIVHATASHGFGLTVDIEPELEMEKVLFAVDELTGLIGAVAVMRPSKSVDDLEVKSVKKKFKDKRFAAGCDRDVIQRGAEMLGWDLDTLIDKTIQAMRASENVD